jgi:1-acyl-sn-glycerol-3-phosphate acyltransferase
LESALGTRPAPYAGPGLSMRARHVMGHKGSVSRGLIRASALLLHVIVGLALSTWHSLRKGSDWHLSENGTRLIQWWAQRSCRIIGLQVRVVGAPVKSPVMLVSNHISWLDIAAIASVHPVRFLSKANVREWPLPGTLASLSGTVFLRRHRLTVLNKAIDTLSTTLAGGQSVAVFPEATTTAGDTVAAFHSAMFQAAIFAESPVQAVAIRYARDGSADRIAPFIKDSAFAFHAFRVMRVRCTEVELHFCQPTCSKHTERRLLAQYTRQQIAEVLGSKPLKEAA